ncbi:MAG TPA: hypothetical protein VIL00_09090 [Pseudonocardiaceae bacterium]
MSTSADTSAPDRSGKSADAPRTHRIAVVVAAVLVVLTGGFAAWSGWSWWSAAHSEDLEYARARDEVLRVGQQGIVNFNTFDHRRLAEDFDRCERSATGQLLEETIQAREKYIERFQEVQLVSEAKVLDAAVTELDLRVGRARVIAAIEIASTVKDEGTLVKRNRLQAELTHTEAGWKLSHLEEVPTSF